MKNGLAFSLDATLAITIAVILIFGIGFNLFKAQSSIFGSLYLSKIANDALITLNKNKTLETLDSQIINNTLKSILPKNLAFKFGTIVYECSDQDCKNFLVVSEKNIYLKNLDIQEVDSVVAKRSFLTFESNRIKYFSISELRVWLI